VTPVLARQAVAQFSRYKWRRIVTLLQRGGLTAVVALAAACAPTGSGRTAPAAAPLIVGVSAIDITPDEPIRLTGYPNRVAALGECL